MFKRNLIAVAVAFTFSGPALAQDADLAKIREEIKQMKDSYEQRIQALEKRLAVAEAKAGKAEQSAASAETAASAAANSRGPNAFNPEISLILQGTYARTSQDPNDYHITGFLPSGGEVGPPKRSFGLQETELAMASNIDPYFRGVAIASLAPEGGASVEEAYFQTLALPQGFTFKGGRFFSGIGYLNEQHQHAWDFQDAPLPYKAFLGTQLKQDGLQLKWIAPTDLFVELGAEVSSGDQFPGNDRNKNGIGGSALFGHIGGDIGTSYAWRTGLSYLQTSAQNRAYQDTDALGNAVTNAFTGDAKLWVADAVLKWAPNGNDTYTNFKLQGEYFRLKQDGQLTYNTALPCHRQLRRRPVGLVPAGHLAVHAALARRLPLRHPALRHRQQRRRDERRGDRGRLPAARELQPVAQHADVRLDRDRVQPHPAAAGPGQVAARGHRQPGVRAIPLQPGRAWRAHVLNG